LKQCRRFRAGAKGRQGERGQALLEFAITAPVLLILLLGLIEFGNALNSYLTVVASARDAARLGSQGGADAASLLNMVDNETERLPDEVPTAAINCGSGAGVCIEGVSGGSPASLTISSRPAVRVKVCYDHELLIGLPGLGTGPIPLCSTTTMRLVSN
jgi:Flp pilus assembly protein TadG